MNRTSTELTRRRFLQAAGLLAGSALLPAPAAVAVDVPRVATLAIYPVDVAFDAPPELSYQKTVDLVQAVSALNRFEIYSYGDFLLAPTDQLDLYEQPSLLSLMTARKVELSGLCILKGRVSIVPLDAFAAAALARQPGHRFGTGLWVMIRLELYHFGQSRSLLVRTRQLALDPLEATLSDPYPRMTLELQRLAKDLLGAAVRQFECPPQFTPLDLDLYSDHSLMFRIASDDRPSLARRLQQLDEIDRQATLLRGYQYFYPAITPLEVQALTRTPGLLVASPPSPWLATAGLREGDIIQALNEEAVSAPHQLQRICARFGGRAVHASIRRGDESLDVSLHLPSSRR